MNTRLMVSTFLGLLMMNQSVSGNSLPFAGASDVGMKGTKLRQIEETVGLHLDRKDLAGAVTLVLRKGNIVHLEAHGWQDLESRTPMSTDTIFRIYSMTKPIVSAGIMMLAEKKLLDLEDPISKHLPEFAGLTVFENDAQIPPKRPPTIRDLLRHTAGFTYGMFGNSPVDRLYQSSGAFKTSNDTTLFLRNVAKLPLAYHPGEKWVYSISVDVQGVLIETITGHSLDRFLEEHFFEPLGMVDTGFHVPKEKRHRFASYYGNGLSLVEPNSESDYRYPKRFNSGGGGLVSTARDYARFLQMLLNKGELFGSRYLTPESIQEMTRNQLSDEAFTIGIGERREGVGFGLGFSVVTGPSTFDPDARVGEYGWGGIASTHFWVSPADELAVITLEQTQPYNWNLERSLKGLIYRALED